MRGIGPEPGMRPIDVMLKPSQAHLGTKLGLAPEHSYGPTSFHEDVISEGFLNDSVVAGATIFES